MKPAAMKKGATPCALCEASSSTTRDAVMWSVVASTLSSGTTHHARPPMSGQPGLLIWS